MADVRLPGTLTPLFPGLPRRLEVEAPTVLAAIDSLEQQWPGLRDRLVAEGPSLRSHTSWAAQLCAFPFVALVGRNCLTCSAHARATR